MKLSIFAAPPGQPAQYAEDLAILHELPADTKIWVDIESDDPLEFAPLAKFFGLHELSIEDCLTPNHFPKLEDYGQFTFIIVRGLKPWSEVEDIWETLASGKKAEITPTPHPHQRKSKEVREEEEKLTRKIAIYLSDRCIITHRRHEISWLDALIRQMSQSPEQILTQGPDAVCYRVMDVLMDRFTRGMNFFENVIEHLEDASFKTPSSFSMSPVLDLKQALVFLRQIIRDQRVVTTKLATDANLPVRKNRRRYFKDIDDHTGNLADIIDKQIDALSGVRDSYFASANVRLSDTMRILAVITTIAAPVNILVGIYGMNFQVMPFLSHPMGFWFMVGLILVVSVTMVAYFRVQRWI